MPLRPLYKHSFPKLQPMGNRGLWYDKFCDRWEEDWKGLVDDGKKEWIKTVINEEIGETGLLQEIAERRSALISAIGGKSLIFRTKGSFVTGLGRSHPVENGFSWNHSLGVPYLPGSSVKGMVRSWATYWNNVDEKEADRIFGPADSTSVGSVIFLDAIPDRPVRLKMEIMTPHYGPYYNESSKDPEPPADWHSPVPIPFLAVDAEQEFLFGIVPRDERTEDCKKVEAWLKKALQDIGAGAKTAVGYGRFACLEPMSPGREWLECLAETEGKTVEDLAKESPKLLAEKWDMIENHGLKAIVHQEIKAIYQKIGYWDNPLGGSAKKVIKEYKSWLEVDS